jgi:hypothetical protein
MDLLRPCGWLYRESLGNDCGGVVELGKMVRGFINEYGSVGRRCDLGRKRSYSGLLGEFNWCGSYASKSWKLELCMGQRIRFGHGCRRAGHCGWCCSGLSTNLRCVLISSVYPLGDLCWFECLVVLGRLHKRTAERSGTDRYRCGGGLGWTNGRLPAASPGNPTPCLSPNQRVRAGVQCMGQLAEFLGCSEGGIAG